MYARYVYKAATASIITPNNMTNNSSGGYVVSSTADYSTYYAYKAFDGTLSATYWATNQVPTPTNPVYLKIDYGVGNTSTHYAYTLFNNEASVTYAPAAWYYQGSNAASPNASYPHADWTTLDIQSNQYNWQLAEHRTYKITTAGGLPGPGAYRHYRIVIVGHNYDANYVGIAEWQAWGSYAYMGQATVVDDIQRLLTDGNQTINIGNLSTLCDQTTTYALNSWCNGGWTVHDAAAGGLTKVCLKAPIHDDNTKYMYVVIDGSQYGFIMLNLYESWSTILHVGANVAAKSNLTTWNQQINIATGGTVYISASPTHIHLYSYQNGVWGSNSGVLPFGSTGVFQRTRRSPWDTIANGYPPTHFIFFPILNYNSTSYVAFAPRLPNANGIDVGGSSAYGFIVTTYGHTLYNYPNAKFPDANKQLSHQLVHMSIAYGGNGFMGGEFSELSDTWYTTYGWGNNLDEITYNGNTYVVWCQAAVNTQRVAVRKG